ncbi:hypothetical protein LOTGIDRAFT_162474 [Lottia gigantea]|uniref:Glycoside hydrolase family 31 N-terminal domain-containing protein n=1 Tax=Lottia gigantea TaxID=225164 RepID=V4AGM4_LOTGI|nr:hypothetical protein LOTGIDRAFT_162474 [Lottia gigantea]ESO92566.1 hypothetical protein LOTGIDRAFT_162474 [Lottia gigantea]
MSKTQQAKEANAPLMRERENEEAIHVQENKRRKRRIMKVAVYMMFGLIVVGVFAVWLFHKDSNESISMGPNFKFTVKARTLEIHNEEGDVVLYADLGMRLKATPYEQCWNDRINKYEVNCIDWRKMAKINFIRNEGQTNSCYSFVWTAFSETFEAEDCFYIQRDNWYGHLSDSYKTWPIKDVQMHNVSYYPKYPDKLEKNIVPFWLSSAGVSIVINNNIPFSVSWNVTAQRQLCISATKSFKSITDQPVLRYTICQGEDMQQTYYRTKEFLEKYLEKIPVIPEINSVTPYPVNYVSNSGDIDKLLSDSRILSNAKCTYFELFNDWEKEYGDLVIKPELLSKLRSLQITLRNHDCKFMVPVSAFFAFSSKNFDVGISEKYFVRDEMNLVSKLLNWDGHEGAVLDITNPNATQWYNNHLQLLLSEIDIGAFKLLHVDIPTLITFQDKNASVLDYPKFFGKMLSDLNVTLVSENVAGFMLNEIHVAVQPIMNVSEEHHCFNGLISNTFLLGLEGYSLIIANGEILTKFDVSDELLTRWLQLVIFYPGIRLPVFLPNLENDVMKKRFYNLSKLRNEFVIPYLRELQENQSNDPLIRPLWWIDPQDSIAQTIDDEFLVGDKILVTPILCEGDVKRQVYLPEGLWKGPTGMVEGNLQMSNTVSKFKLCGSYLIRIRSDL